MRTHLSLSQKIIVATAVLFNIGRMWGDEPPDDEDAEQDTNDDHNVVIQDGDAGGRLLRGQIKMDILSDKICLCEHIYKN